MASCSRASRRCSNARVAVGGFPPPEEFFVTVAEKQNGHRPKGRDVPPLPEFTLPDSGVTLRIIAPMGPLIQLTLGKQLRRERTEPQPPINLVDYGDGKKVPEPNPADPDYEKALQDYNAWVQSELVERTLEYILSNCIDADVDKAAVARTRKAMMSIGVDLADVDDRDVYLRYVAIASTSDLLALREVVERTSKPTEVVIREEVASF